MSVIARLYAWFARDYPAAVAVTAGPLFVALAAIVLAVAVTR